MSEAVTYEKAAISARDQTHARPAKVLICSLSKLQTELAAIGGIYSVIHGKTQTSKGLDRMSRRISPTSKDDRYQRPTAELNRSGSTRTIIPSTFTPPTSSSALTTSDRDRRQSKARSTQFATRRFRAKGNRMYLRRSPAAGAVIYLPVVARNFRLDCNAAKTPARKRKRRLAMPHAIAAVLPWLRDAVCSRAAFSFPESSHTSPTFSSYFMVYSTIFAVHRNSESRYTHCNRC